MTSFRDGQGRIARGRWAAAALLVCGLSALTAAPARAQDCSDYDGVLDGFEGDVAPSQLQIDQNCTIRNYPDGIDTNFSFYTQPGQNPDRWLVVFDNVVHNGNMSCNSVLEHKIWFTNGSSTTIQEGCQNLLIPVEKIDKQNPEGTTTAAIGVPFTYSLTIPVLFDAGTQTVINDSGSLNDLHSVIIWDDLNETGADLTYLSHEAYWKDTGAPVGHTFANDSGLLTFDISPVVPAGEQMIIEITVVLDDSPANAVGTQFVNTAKWEFGRLIDGVFYEPLPGEWGITEPLTIAAPELVVTKSGPATIGRTLNLGEWGEFEIDVHNTGLSDAWDVTIVDELPDGPMGGMCERTPEILSAQVFEADGTTPAPGKGPLTPGVDFTFDYDGSPRCELTLTMLTADAAIGPDERLIVTYRTQLDPDSDDGVTLTNVVGAIEWFNGDASNPDRVAFTRPLTNGTVGTADHEDAHTVTVELFGYFYEKSVANLTSGADPAQTAAPGDTLRYTLRLQSTDGPLDDLTFYDDLGALNAQPAFEPGSLSIVAGTLPPGADASNTDPYGGTNGTGLLDIRDLSLPAFSEVEIQFDVTLDPSLIDGTIVTNQSDLLSAGSDIADSDDPNVNGQADPSVDGDEDPTQVLVETEPPPGPTKDNTQAAATIGEEFSYRITVPSTPHSAPLYDVRILDDLSASDADLEFVDVTRISGSGSWTPVNTGTATNLVIEDTGDGIDIPAGEQAVVEVTVRLADTGTNEAGLQFANTSSYTYNLVDGNDASQRPGGSDTTPLMTIVEPDVTLEKSGPTQLLTGVPGTFTLDVHNVADSPAYDLTITDVLPNTAEGGMCDAAPTNVTAQLFESDGVTPAGPALTAGSDFSVAFDGDPDCTWTVTTLTPAAVIGPDERLIVTYEASLDGDSEADAVLTNVAGATSWHSVEASSDGAREYTRAVTDGTPGVLDHEDALTLIVNQAVLRFEKTVANVTRGDDPGIRATPGDTLRYRIEVENLIDGSINDFRIVDELDSLNDPAAFQAGTLSLVTVPAGADTSNTSATGGAGGTGLLDVRSLSLGGLGETVVVEFEVELAPVIADGSYVLNQSELVTSGVTIAQTDDPNVNGTADPDVFGDEDPTRIQIESAPALDVDKISSYLDGDPDVLLAGETLRYTITVENVGTDNATDTVLRDEIPANTAYVAGSTTLNGDPVPDPGSGLPPLSEGIDINSPADATPGFVRADPAATGDHAATIVFDVIVDPDLVDGSIISNQAFVSALAGGVSEQPSDDPRTPVADDPTRDAVGNVPLIYAEKSAALEVDMGSPGVVDPGDVLRYTITVYNDGAASATGAVLSDAVPANTSYVGDSTTLNGEPVGQPDGGAAPLEAGIPISSADLTPPLPGAGEGTLTPGEAAVVQFELRVDDGVASGTLITNQATVASAELADVPTDGDGDPATGPEPTVVVVGDGQQLAIAKQVAVLGGGTAVAGATLQYTVRVTNIASVPATYVEISDDLDLPEPGRLTYVAGSATLNGATAGVSVDGSTLSADYGAVNGPLEPGGEIVLGFRAEIDPDLPIGTTVTNTAEVSWNDPPQTASASVSIDVGGVVGVGILNGTAWHDANFDDAVDAGERALAGWTVQLYRNGEPIHTTLTDADGVYRINGLAPNYLSEDVYALGFAAPGAGARTAPLGVADSDFTDALQRIDDIVVRAGNNLQNLNMPIEPHGVVYDSITRAPVAGAVLTLLDAGGAPLPGSCLDAAAQQDQLTLADGYYRFDVNFADPACPSPGEYLIGVQPPGAGYVDGYSEIIPPLSAPAGGPFDVPGCPGSAADAVPATPEHCEAQPSALAPPVSVAARSPGTAYHVLLTLDSSAPPGTSQLFNNHIPLDPELDDALSITKTTPLLDVRRGQLVPYTITVTNELGFDLTDVDIVDRLPGGFRYVEGSARIDDEPAEPTSSGRELVWRDLGITGAGRHTLQLLLAVGAGVSEGEFVNRAQVVHALSGEALSSEAQASVRIVPDPDFDCTDVMGKVFDDANRNGVQDAGEGGLPGVRLVSARGLSATTDAHGRYHITCATVPHPSRGSNFVLKLDDRTLPSGYRASMQPVRVERATRGKALKLDFGASIHRVIGIDVSDPVFEPGTAELRSQWRPRIGLLVEELEKAPAVLRLSYLADIEDPGLVNERLDAIERQIREAWQADGCCYELVIEPQVFWRRGGPPKPARSR